VVDAVAISPTRLVVTASAASTVIGSSHVRGAPFSLIASLPAARSQPPGLGPTMPLTDIRYYQDLAQRAEAALFDSGRCRCRQNRHPKETASIGRSGRIQ
jgi:hypothetical protein